MLESLFGSKSVIRILLFLFVHEKSYATQLSRLLKTPLTPIQKALSKLEEGGILSSYYLGKTRLYQFNQACALRPELESLLKKAYTLLSPQEKKTYCFTKSDLCSLFSEYKEIKKQHSQCLTPFWERLQGIRKLTCTAKTKTIDGQERWMKGSGDVFVYKIKDDILVFDEKGYWKLPNHEMIGFTNTFRWTLDKKSGIISLERLLNNSDDPVLMIPLEPSGSNSLESLHSYLCGEDTYISTIVFDTNRIQINWRIIGPKKNENVEYCYN